MSQVKLDMLITVGRSPLDSELFKLTENFQHNLKALLPICGKPIIEWIIDAIEQCENIGDTYIVGLSPEQFPDTRVTCIPYPAESKIVDKIQAWIDWYEENKGELPKYIVNANADIPLITSEAVDHFVEESLKKEADFVFALVEKDTMDAKFPNSMRTFTKFSDVTICGGDLFLYSPIGFDKVKEKVHKLQAKRKNFLLQAIFLSPIKALKMVFKGAKLEEAETVFSRGMRMKGRALISPYAEIAMDIDKPEQYKLVEKMLCDS